MSIAILLFAVGLILLIKGGDWFVDGATGIAHRFNIPEILIGATVVSIGTTLPEVMVSASSAVGGHSEIAYGNAIGSIICNTALVSAITIAFMPSLVNKKTLKTPVIFFYVAAAFYMFMAYTQGGFARWTGIVLLTMFVVYMIVTVRQAIKNPDSVEVEEDGGEADVGKKRNLTQEIGLLIIGAALIALGARLLVDNGTIIATELGVPESVIALTFVALGTSLPELVTAITSLVKGHGSLSLGNVIGANLFNLVLVSGLAITLRPFDLPGGKMIAGMNASLVVDTPVMAFVMLFLTVPALIRGKLSRAQGVILLLVYAAFCAFQFMS